MKTPRRYQSRTGFTLTELLVAITILAILAGLLTPVVMNSLRTAKEATIILEIKQLEMAMEQFKNDNGFYPPSFERGVNAGGASVGITGPAALRRYVNRMSPSNAENSPSGVGTGSASDGSLTRLEHWWVEVGQFLDQESSLVFWLSGTCKNKQFPITGGATSPVGTPPLSAHSLDAEAEGIEREVLFDFQAAQIVGTGAVLKYQQRYGAQGTDLVYKYRDAASYDIGGMSSSTSRDAYRLGPPNGSETVPIGSKAPYYTFVNPKTFQLVTSGIDGLSGAAGNIYAANNGVVNRTDDAGASIQFVGFEGADNLCNFAEGRLEKYILNQ